MRTAKLMQVKYMLADGGYVRRYSSDGYMFVADKDGKIILTVDGRTIQPFLETVAPELAVETQQVRQDTVTTWRTR